MAATQGGARSIDDFPIVQRFDGWSRRTSIQGDCRCPAHEDRKASLSIGIGDNGNLSIDCKAGCNTGDVLRNVGGMWSDLFYQSATSSGSFSNSNGSGGNSKNSANPSDPGNQQQQPRQQPRGKIVAVYSYCDQNNQEQFQVVRFHPKDFRQRHRSADGKKWIWKSVDQSKRIIYQLPSILAAPPDAPIFLVEGEKDADRLRASGILATTSPGGASSGKSKNKWLPQYTITLRPHPIFILPDSDKSGQEHTEHVARELSSTTPGPYSFVAIVKLPILPGLSPDRKWDVSDWLDAGGTREQFFQAVAEAEQNPFDPTAAPPPPPTIGNADEDPTGSLTPINIAEITRRITEQTGNWPRRVGSALFVDRTEALSGTISQSEKTGLTHSLHWLERTSQLFAFIGAKTHTPPTFHKLPGAHTKEEVFSGLQQSSTAYQAVEILPHEPPIPSHYYACDTPDPGDGSHLLALVQRFAPATPIDCDLILCLFATLLWGGPGGSRPAFVITSDDGRGVGKSKMAGMVSHLASGVIEISANEDSSKMKERLLSPEGLTKRVALLDNVKTLRFSWAELEALITSPIVSGKRLYVGEASRPNNLTWIITLNGVSLSTDMAQRSVVIKIKRPSHSGDWEEETRQYIDNHRQQIIADLIGFLRGPRTPLIRFTRWGSWERAVLSLLDDPDGAQQEIIARQESSDVEEEDASLIVEFFRQQLQELSYQTEHDKVFIPSAVAAEWLCKATNERHSVTGACRMLKQKCSEGAIRDIQVHSHHGHGRGFVWFPKQAIGDLQMNLRQRIDNPPQSAF